MSATHHSALDEIAKDVTVHNVLQAMAVDHSRS
jgi:hypothetical protein